MEVEAEAIAVYSERILEDVPPISVRLKDSEGVEHTIDWASSVELNLEADRVLFRRYRGKYKISELQRYEMPGKKELSTEHFYATKLVAVSARPFVCRSEGEVLVCSSRLEK